METSRNTPIEWMTSGPGVRRRILANGQDLMMVEFRFARNGVGEPHSHPHAQTTFVQSGVFRFTVADSVTTLEPGDSLYIPPDTVHACVALEEGTLIDAFTPSRIDFLEAHGMKPVAN